jgi:predicted N-acetyltransferase YhbS
MARNCDEAPTPCVRNGADSLRRADPQGLIRAPPEESRNFILSQDVSIRPEQPGDDSYIQALQQAAFGPGAYARAAFRVREQAPHDSSLSFVAEREGDLIASVRLTPITVGERRGMLLGPLVVDPCCMGQGHGKALMRRALESAREAGCGFVLLIGDASYYGAFGFRAVSPRSVSLPGPADPARILVAELQTGAAEGLSGTVAGALTPASAT